MRGLGDHLSIGERIAFYRKRRGYTQEVLAGLVGRSTDWLAKAETGRRQPPRIDMLAELARVLRVPLGDLVGHPVLLEDEAQQDDVPAVRDALMSPRRLSRLLFGPEAGAQLPTPGPVALKVEEVWSDYQSGRLGRVIAALPGLLQTAQELEDRGARSGSERRECWAVSARTHHLAATTLAKIGSRTSLGSPPSEPCEPGTSPGIRWYWHRLRELVPTRCWPTAATTLRSNSAAPPLPG
jgi:transcriptional regulator with XRE-family HTH domain